MIADIMEQIKTTARSIREMNIYEEGDPSSFTRPALLIKQGAVKYKKGLSGKRRAVLSMRLTYYPAEKAAEREECRSIQTAFLRTFQCLDTYRIRNWQSEITLENHMEAAFDIPYCERETQEAVKMRTYQLQVHDEGKEKENGRKLGSAK